jgi:membrane-bound lytic murein transglycosylase D
MNKNLILISTLILTWNSRVVAFTALQQPAADTAVDNKLVEEVIHSQKPPSPEKVQYISQVTRYGFRNLFSNLSYNPGMPYADQMNSRATGFIEEYMRTHGTYLNQMKGWGRPYFNLIETLLQQYGLPKELKYIAVIESNLKPGAVSVKGACGPWQFMPGTARQLGLTINAFTDERTDYFKSTHAAARYLLQLYEQLHDWLLVMAAYNGGAGRVLSAIQRSGSRNFWDIQYFLPEESRTYVKRFIATHYIMEGNSGKNGEWAMGNGNALPYSSGGNGYAASPTDLQRNMEGDDAAGISNYSISGKYNSLVIAKNLSMDITQFNSLNPSFDYIITSNGNYDIRLPQDKMQLFLSSRYQILNECVQIMLNNDTVITNPVVYGKTPYDRYGTRKTSTRKKRRI